MRSIFSNNYESDNDERLDKKFSYNYQVIKRMYPKASELPEEEVRGIIRKYYQAPKGQEEQAIKDYIRQKEPEWHQLYGLDYEDKEENQNQDSNSFWQPMQNNDFWGGYGNKQNTLSSTTPQSSDNTKTLGDYFMDNVADIGYGAKKALSGMTFGASDWALRRLGLDNEQEYLAKKQAEGLGGLTKGLGVASEIGGNILGAGGALVRGLQNAGFKGLRLATTAGGAEGLAYGLTGSDRLADVPENMAWGAGLGAALPVAFHGAGQSVRAIAKPFSSRLMTTGMKGGLNNVASNPNAVKILKQGLRNNDDIAQSYLEHVLPATRDINRGTAEMVDNALTRRINVPETIAAERARYGDYMATHGADEVMDFAPTREQMINYPAESSFNLPKKTLTSSKAENILRNRAQNSGVDIGGNIDHYLNKRGRAQYVRTLSNTLENPDITYSLGNKNYFAKKYNGVQGKEVKPFNDFIVKKDGKLYTKFVPDDLDYVSNQLRKNNPQDLSLRGVTNSTEPTGGKVGTAFYDNNIPQQFQLGQLDKAIKTGLSKTNQKAGSLESLNKIKQEINEAIAKAKSTDKPSEVWQLQELKSKFDDAMPQGLKEVDAGFSRAKSLEDAFNKGTHYNPDNVSGADMIKGLSADEQNAFAQGLFKRINNNSLSRKDLAKDALKYENTLSQVLPQDAYNQLIQGLNRQSTRFGRLSELGRIAENRLRAPEGTHLFGREQLESKGSLIGSGIDWANNLLRGGAIRRSAFNLLNPSFNGVPARESFVVRNPALSAGLTPTALNNLGFYQNQ